MANILAILESPFRDLLWRKWNFYVKLQFFIGYLDMTIFDMVRAEINLSLSELLLRLQPFLFRLLHGQNR